MSDFLHVVTIPGLNMAGILSSSNTTLQSSALWILFWVLSPNQAMFFHLLSLESYTSAGLYFLHSPYVSYLKDSWYDVLHYHSEHHVMPPIVPSGSMGVLTAVEDIHHSTVVIATQNA